MTKNEIIQAVEDSAIPEGAIVERRDLSHGVTLGRVRGDRREAGTKIMFAGMFAGRLRIELREVSSEATPLLLETIHLASVLFFRNFELPTAALREDIWQTYQGVVRTLRRIAKEQGLTYTEPEDPPWKE